MNYQEAKTKAVEQIKASNGSENAYVIPFELGDYIKNMVGKKYNNPKMGTVEVVEWVGQNYIVKKNDGSYGVVPAMYHAQYVKSGALVEVK